MDLFESIDRSLPFLLTIITTAAGYGSLHSRVKMMESELQDTVSRREHEALERRLLEIVQELRSLRAEIVAAVIAGRKGIYETDA